MCMGYATYFVPQQAQLQACQDILEASPPNIGAPERAARQCMPRDLAVSNTTADAVAQYLSRGNLSPAERKKLRAIRQSIIGAKRAAEP